LEGHLPYAPRHHTTLYLLGWRTSSHIGPRSVFFVHPIPSTVNHGHAQIVMSGEEIDCFWPGGHTDNPPAPETSFYGLLWPSCSSNKRHGIGSASLGIDRSSLAARERVGSTRIQIFLESSLCADEASRNVGEDDDNKRPRQQAEERAGDLVGHTTDRLLSPRRRPACPPCSAMGSVTFDVDQSTCSGPSS
jgi:hypothetical protein